MIGFYILSADAQGNVAAPSAAVVAETAFLPDSSCEMTFAFKPTKERPSFVIVPCTYGSGRAGEFQLTVSSASEAFILSALNAETQAGG
jgi:hypothetical protein